MKLDILELENFFSFCIVKKTGTIIILQIKYFYAMQKEILKSGSSFEKNA